MFVLHLNVRWSVPYVLEGPGWLNGLGSWIT